MFVHVDAGKPQYGVHAVATRPISVGEEIFVTYVSTQMNRLQTLTLM
jgi:hypothetical protein